MNIVYNIDSNTGLMNLRFKRNILDPLANKDIFEKYILPKITYAEYIEEIKNGNTTIFEKVKEKVEKKRYYWQIPKRYDKSKDLKL